MDREAISCRYAYNSDTGEIFFRSGRSQGKPAGYRHSKGYISLSWVSPEKNTHLLAHRVAWILAYGEEPDQIDHINGDKKDNRLVNLRSVSNRINHQNMPWHRGGKLVGVIYETRNTNRPYMGRVKINGSLKWLGSYETPEEANKAYMIEAARIEKAN